MKTAIFLGAGASAADGAPLQFQIIPQFFRLFNEKAYRDEEVELTHIHNELCEYFRLLFSIDMIGEIGKISFPSFEEALGKLDNQDKDSLQILHKAGITQIEDLIQKQRYNLILLLTWVLFKKLESETGENHLKLITNLKKHDKMKDILFITTNYDILIDNSIHSINGQFETSQIPNYGDIDFQNYHYVEYKLQRPTPDSIKLYKLHGSLNWLFCKKCKSAILYPGQKELMNLIFVPEYCICPECGSKLTPLIIPPSCNKNVYKDYLTSIWKQTEIELHEVEHIVFCGYSFPDADMHIKDVIKKAQTRRENKVHFTVINYHTGKEKKQMDEEKDRYFAMFGKENVTYLHCSFEEFSSNPRNILDKLVHT